MTSGHGRRNLDGTRFSQAKRDAAATTSTKSSAPVHDDARSKRILIVEGNANLARLLGRVLRPWQPIVADDAPDALRRIRAGQRFEAVLCDIATNPHDVGGIDGLSFFEIVEREAPEQAASFLFLYAGARSDRELAFVNQHAGRVIAKPFDAEELKTRVRALLEFGQ